MKLNTNPETKEEIEINKNKLKSNKGPYILGEKLGEGAFAKVRLATQIHIKEKCAVKILEKKLLESSRDIQRLKKEIKILKKLRHKNIVQLYDIMESKHNLYFVMEYCKNGELFDYIVSKKRLKETEACCFFQQIINGVEYLHNQGIIHRDLKPENLLLDDKNHIKISDFGLSTFFSKNNYLQTACGTPSYAPPEMLEGHEYNGEATDVWSCGIILYAMLCGTLPYSESTEEIIVKKIKTHDYVIPNYLSKDAKDLLNHILIINPKERYNIKQIQSHPWFNLVKAHMVPGINLEEDIIPVDEKILDMVKNYGFDPVECKDLLLKNKFCSLTTIYYLCLKKYMRGNGKSISDLESDLFEEYIKDPKNKVKKGENEDEIKERKESNDYNSNYNLKTERENNHIYNIRLPMKKVDLNKNEKNIQINIDKSNGSPTLNYIKLTNDKRNLMSSKNIKKGYTNTETNNDNIKSKNNNENKSPLKGNQNNEKKKNEVSKEYNRNIRKIKNKSPLKTTAKTIYINKSNSIKNKDNNKETLKNKSLGKNKLKIINSHNKVKKTNISEQKPKTMRLETEKKPIKSKFVLKEEIKDNQQPNGLINTNVNIINININNNQAPNNYNIPERNSNILHNLSSSENTFSDKDLPLLLKQKLNDISQKNEIKINDNNTNNINMREDEDEIKALLSSLNLKEVNSSIINQSNLNYNLFHNNNNSNLYSSIFQDSAANSQTKTFIDVPNNYSLKNDNNISNNNSRPKSSLFQYLGNDIEKYMLMKGERPINVINYIAKKLVASSFCGSFNIQNRKNNSYMNYNNLNNLNNNINQLSSFLKKSSEDNNSLRKSNGIGENKNENSSENNTITKDSKDTSLFINEDNDDKDLNFKNLVSILNKKFKSYLSKEKLNKSEVFNKNYNSSRRQSEEYNDNDRKNSLALNMNKISFIKDIKNEGNKNNLFKSFNFQKTNTNTEANNNNNKKDDNSYIVLSYSKKDKINKTNIKYNKSIKNKSKINQTEIKESSNKNPSKIININSHRNTFLDISTNYEPNMDSRNSSVERSISFNNKDLRNFSCSPSHENKKKKEIDNIKKGQIVNLTKKNNKNFNTISEDDELKEKEKRKNISKERKKKKGQICHNKVTINLSKDDNFNNNDKDNKKVKPKLKKIVTKKK